MMTPRANLLLLLSLLALGCGHASSPGGPTAESSASLEGQPDWVVALVRKLESEPVANPPASVTRYTYAGQTVYYLPPHCCDVEGELYDATGALLCHPDGGFTGHGDGRCPDFFTARTDEAPIWRDTRK